MKVIFTKSIMLLFMSMFTIGSSFATIYYVAIDGNNSNNGTSLNTAFRNINYAVNFPALTGGDIIYIKGGTYTERVIMTKSGTSDQSRILIKNYDATIPVIDGAGILWDYIDGVSGLFEIRSRYVTLDGIKVINCVANSNAAGILVRGPSTSFVTVIRCVTNNTRTSGIAIWGRTKGNDYSGATDIRIEACDISGAVNDGYHEHLTIAEGVDRYVICWNKVHDQTKEPKDINLPIGIDSKVNVRNGKIYGNQVYNLYKSNGIYVDAWDSEAYNIEIYNNIIHDVDNTGIPIGAEEGGVAHDIKVYNNLIYRVGQNGLVLSRENNTLGNNMTSSTYNVSFYNNTVYKCGYYAAHVLNLNTPNCSFKNNIFSQNGFSNAITVYSGNKNNVTVENNITNGVQNAYLQGMEIKLGANNISQDPQFAYADGNNFRLGAASPAINAGTNTLRPDNDLDWNSRANTGIVDIGAYEHGAIVLSSVKNSCGLITNSSFENDFASWSNVNTAASIGSAAQSRTGSKCAVLNGTTGLGTTGFISVNAANKINFKVYAKIEGSPIDPQIGIDYRNNAGAKLGSNVFKINTTSYKLYSVFSRRLPAGTTKVNIWTSKGSTAGKIYMDDFCLTNSDAANRESSELGFAVDEEINDFRIYPNPASNILHVSTLYKNEQSMIVTIIDVTGKQVIERTFDINNGQDYVELNIKNLLPGNYFVKVLQGYNQKTFKLIKE